MDISEIIQQEKERAGLIQGPPAPVVSPAPATAPALPPYQQQTTAPLGPPAPEPAPQPTPQPPPAAPPVTPGLQSIINQVRTVQPGGVPDMIHRTRLSEQPQTLDWQTEARRAMDRYQARVGGRPLNPDEVAAFTNAYRDRFHVAAPTLPSDTPEQLAAKTAADNSNWDNFALATTDTLAKAGTGLVGIVAPGTAADMHREQAQAYASRPGVSQTAGHVAGFTIQFLPAVLSGGATAGPTVFGFSAAAVNSATIAGTAASTFGNKRAEIELYRQQTGIQVPLENELAAASANAAVDYFTQRFGMKLTHLGAERMAAKYLPQLAARIAAKDTPEVARILLRMGAEEGAKEVAGNAALGATSQIAKNAVDHFTYDPKRHLTEGAGQAAIEGGAGAAVLAPLGALNRYAAARQLAAGIPVAQPPAKAPDPLGPPAPVEQPPVVPQLPAVEPPAAPVVPQPPAEPPAATPPVAEPPPAPTQPPGPPTGLPRPPLPEVPLEQVNRPPSITGNPDVDRALIALAHAIQGKPAENVRGLLPSPETATVGPEGTIKLNEGHGPLPALEHAAELTRQKVGELEQAYYANERDRQADILRTIRDAATAHGVDPAELRRHVLYEPVPYTENPAENVTGLDAFKAKLAEQKAPAEPTPEEPTPERPPLRPPANLKEANALRKNWRQTYPEAAAAVDAKVQEYLDGASYHRPYEVAVSHSDNTFVVKWTFENGKKVEDGSVHADSFNPNTGKFIGRGLNPGKFTTLERLSPPPHHEVPIQPGGIRDTSGTPRGPIDPVIAQFDGAQTKHGTLRVQKINDRYFAEVRKKPKDMPQSILNGADEEIARRELARIVTAPPPGPPPQAPMREKPAAKPAPAPAPFAEGPGDSPAMRQWKQFKQQYPDYLMLFRMGDFYEAFHQDAETLSKVTGIHLAKRGDVPMAGVPFHAVEGYMRKLIAAGHKVAVAEMAADAPKGIVKREVQTVEPATRGDVLEYTGESGKQAAKGDKFTVIEEHPATGELVVEPLAGGGTMKLGYHEVAKYFRKVDRFDLAKPEPAAPAEVPTLARGDRVSYVWDSGKSEGTVLTGPFDSGVKDEPNYRIKWETGPLAEKQKRQAGYSDHRVQDLQKIEPPAAPPKNLNEAKARRTKAAPPPAPEPERTPSGLPSLDTVKIEKPQADKSLAGKLAKGRGDLEAWRTIARDVNKRLMELEQKYKQTAEYKNGLAEAVRGIRKHKEKAQAGYQFERQFLAGKADYQKIGKEYDAAITRRDEIGQAVEVHENAMRKNEKEGYEAAKEAFKQKLQAYPWWELEKWANEQFDKAKPGGYRQVAGEVSTEAMMARDVANEKQSAMYKGDPTRPVEGEILPPGWEYRPRPEPRHSYSVSHKPSPPLERPFIERGKVPADYRAEVVKPEHPRMLARDLALAGSNVPEHEIVRAGDNYGAVREFASVVPEFKLDPHFTVVGGDPKTGEGAKLVFEGENSRFAFYPSALGVVFKGVPEVGKRVYIDPAAKVKKGEVRVVDARTDEQQQRYQVVTNKGGTFEIKDTHTGETVPTGSMLNESYAKQKAKEMSEAVPAKEAPIPEPPKNLAGPGGEASRIEPPPREVLERFAKDGKRFAEGNCTECAGKVIDKFGGDLVGYFREDNPGGTVGEYEGGHDFAIVGNRYLVDPWAVHAEGSSDRPVLDLRDAADVARVRELYGDPSTWRRYDGKSWVSYRAPIGGPSSRAGGEGDFVEPIKGPPPPYGGPMKAPTPGNPGGQPAVPHGAMSSFSPNLLKRTPMPELIKFATDILGKVPDVKKLASAWGMFRWSPLKGWIEIDPATAADPRQLASTVAHEIGHAVDYLPDQDLRRGNLVGRVRSLLNFTKGQFGPGGPTNAVMRKELMALSAWWRPGNMTTPYRKSGKELYADFMSVLLNSPGDAAQRAPAFYGEFMRHLSAKPAVLDAYTGVQKLLSGTPDEIAGVREKDLIEDMGAGEAAMHAGQQLREDARASIVELVRQHLFSKARPFLKRLRAVEKTGAVVPESVNPKYALEDLDYTDNDGRVFLEAAQNKAVAPYLEHPGTSMEDIGEYMFLTRVQNGDRAGVANPRGFTPAEAGEQLAYMARRLGPDAYGQLERSAGQYRDLVFGVMRKAHNAGIISDDVFYKTIEPNRDSYAHFGVIDHLEEAIPAAIRSQIGTFKGVGNSFATTALKTLAMIRLTNLQNAKIAGRDFLMRYYPGDIEKLPIRRGPGGMLLDPRPPKPGMDHLTIMQDGIPVHYETDKWIVRAFQRHDIGSLDTVGRVLSNAVYKPFHALFVKYNPVWQAANYLRDFQRTYKNLGAHGVSLGELLASYWRAAGPSARRARGVTDPMITDMLKEKALDVPYVSFEYDDERTAYQRMLDRAGLGDQKDVGRTRKLLMQIPHWVEAGGVFSETLSKVAGYDALKQQGVMGPKERAYAVRNFTGTPNIKRKGLATVLVNGLFMYENVALQGLRADLEIATKPSTRAGYAMRSVMMDVVPKVAMRAAKAGLFGAGVAAMMKGISSYDLANYITIPMGWWNDDPNDPEKKRVMYLRIPQDKTDQLLQGIAWHMVSTNWLHDPVGQANKLFDFAWQQTPSLSPPLSIAKSWADYLRGHNPTDDFRGGHVLTDDEQKAGGVDAARKMGAYTRDQLGIAGQIIKWLQGGADYRKETGLPPFIKVSDRGYTESDYDAIREKDKDAARFRLTLPDEVHHAMTERNRLTRLGKEQLTDKQLERKADLDDWYSKVYLKLTQELKDPDLSPQERKELLEELKSTTQEYLK